MDINLNAAECIKEQANFGHNAYYNICSGAVEVVNWGAMDWVNIVVSSVVGVALMALMAFITWGQLND